ncbi:hypothetical protein GCM10025857_05350 [Alicyclobacillus contaminans]|uniref:hypothetical protein n=1 Tax=Alicyclobacillus contaminans TaxID=392016 RepID=UPI000423FE0A|nr:hypothetical protein [Alicyclobacillus contaminans]GMA49178.1 hypothetical protein GCM10025857_05350 [Alicyclobacillus contaminans]
MLATKETVLRERTEHHGALPGDGAHSRAQARQAWKGALGWVCCVATCVGAGWFVAAKGAEIDQLSYQVDHMQAQIQKTQAENASLSSTVDELLRPARILGIALGRLHMQYANPVQISNGNP